MEDEAPVIYGLEFQARALAAQTAETDQIRFIVGTQSLRQENQIHHIDFDDENNTINKNVFLHREGEIWHISASTLDKDLLATCYNKTSESKAEMCAALWRLPADFDDVTQPEDQSTSQSLELVCNLDATDYWDMKRTWFWRGHIYWTPCISQTNGMQSTRFCPCLGLHKITTISKNHHSATPTMETTRNGSTCSVMWHPMGDSSTVIGLADNHILLWDVDTASSSARLTNSTGLETKGQPKLTCASWNPHHNSTQIATANDTYIRGWDLRSMQQCYTIDNAHGQLVRDVDFNPNKQYYLVSCGDDCKVKFWDTRKVTEPLLVLADHSHWVWSVRYNHFHDQLVLSSSSDSRVVLNNIISLSSEPYGHLIENDDSDDDNDDDNRDSREVTPPEDGVISTYEEHEDSVYAVDWSSADPWVFASLSYDGRLVINRVPRAEKYKILL